MAETSTSPSTAPEPFSLLQLPTEVIVHIGASTQNKRDLSRLCRANRFLLHALTSLLYRRDVDEYKSSALRWAAERQCIPTARNSLAAGADVTDPQVLRSLIGIHGDYSKYAEELERPSNSPYLEWSYARVRECREMLCLLLEHGARPGIDQLYAGTAVAMQTRNVHMLDLLRDRTEALRQENLDVPWMRRYPIAHAGMHGTPAMFNRLLQDFRARGIPADDILTRPMLVDIISHGPASMLGCLLTNKLLPPDILLDNLDLNALERVIEWVSPREEEKMVKVKMLLESDLVIWNRRNRLTGRTPFASCCIWGTAAMAELFLQRPEVDPNLTDHDGTSPYLLAFNHKYDDVFGVLVRSDRIDPVHKKQKAARILAHALTERDTDMVRLLLEYGHAGDDYVWILHKAVQEENLEIIQLLVEKYGVDVDAQDGFGNTPLRFAMQQHKAQSAKCLIDLGADMM